MPQPAPSEDVLRDMVRALEEIGTNGGLISSDPPKKSYDFPSGNHTSLDYAIHSSLWMFGLAPAARGLLDHMGSEHDENGQIHATQAQLAEHFNCSQPKISKALTQLTKLHFAWKIRRGVVQVNPTYAYRWGSKKHRALMAKIGKKTLDEHTIVIPEAGRSL